MSIRQGLSVSLAGRSLFRFDPGADTVIAVLSGFMMTGIYYLNSVTGGASLFVFFVLFLTVGNVILNVIFPTYYVCLVRREPIANLGITKDGWILALLISLAYAAYSFPALLEIAERENADLLVQMLFNALILWEVFFVFGWLQLRFERAFGAIPAPLITGLFFGMYHVGTYSLSSVLKLMLAGAMYGAFFGLTRNLLTLFPLAWSVVSSIGTIHGGIIAQWSWVYMYAVILMIQVIGIVLIHRSATAGTRDR